MEKELDDILKTLSTRSKNCLKAANLYTVDDLVKYESWQLLKFRHFGKKSIDEIVLKLANCGYALGQEIKKEHKYNIRSITKIDNGWLLTCGKSKKFFADFPTCAMHAFAYEYENIEVGESINFSII